MRLSFLTLTLIIAMGLSAALMAFISYLVVDIGTQPAHGEVIRQEAQSLLERPTATTNPAFSEAATIISPEQARAIAETATGIVADKVELEHKRGVTVYEVYAGRYEVYVDAVSGQILYQAVK